MEVIIPSGGLRGKKLEIEKLVSTIPKAQPTQGVSDS